MIQDACGPIDYEESGTGPTVVLVPGSCSTGAAWRPVMQALGERFRCVTTSLLGYGGTAERRTTQDHSISHEIDVVEAVIRKADDSVHLVGHSFGGLVVLATALRNSTPLASLTIIEAPAMVLLREQEEHQHYRTFRRMTDAYFADFENGNAEAIAAMFDFYGGTAGVFAAWPARVRAYAIETTRVNILDWASGYDFPLSREPLAAINVPTLIIRGAVSPPAVQRANELLVQCIGGAVGATVQGAAHFMIMTHASEVADLIARHVQAVDESNTTSEREFLSEQSKFSDQRRRGAG